MEEGGNRWSKPHVATLSLHSLFELRSLLLNGTVMLDMEASSLEQIADLFLENMMSAGSLTEELKDKVRDGEELKTDYYRCALSSHNGGSGLEIPRYHQTFLLVA